MALTHAEEAELLALLEDVHGKPTFREFLAKNFPHEPPPPHLDELIDLIQRASEGPVRATVSMPPRHAKSVTICRGIVWMMTLRPDLQHAFLSYSEALTNIQSRQTRRWAAECGVELDQDSKAVTDWSTAAHGGLRATGIKGGITGIGITGLAIVDDPFKNREDANSELSREKIFREFQSSVITRLQPGASVIIIQTRWHEDDLIGRMHNPEYKMGDWEDICQPAIQDPETGEAASDGVALWPEQYPIDALEDIRGMVGEYDFWSLYQQSPRPKGSEIFKQDIPRFSRQDFKVDGHRLVIGVDPAASAKTKADHSVAVVMAAKGYGAATRFWVLEVYRAQVSIPDLCTKLQEIQARYQVPLAIEAVGAFVAIPQILQEANPNLRLLPVILKGDKHARAQPLSAAWNDDRVYVPMDMPWANTFMAEMGKFTGVKDKADDQVDAAAHAFTALYRSPQRRVSRSGNFLPWG